MAAISVFGRQDWVLAIEVPAQTMVMPATKAGSMGVVVSSMGPPCGVFFHPTKTNGLVYSPVYAEGSFWIICFLSDWDGKENGLIIGSGVNSDLMIQDDSFAEAELCISVNDDEVNFNVFLNAEAATLSTNPGGPDLGVVPKLMAQRPNNETPLGPDFGQGHCVTTADGKQHWRFLLVELKRSFQAVASEMAAACSA